ncbi:hypothetical protein MXD81_54830, partial [Microbacteriaceae bacterium K1510]|nr:hypothetical protein [Microbacteriaceae bacterium K1510]
ETVRTTLHAELPRLFRPAFEDMVPAAIKTAKATEADTGDALDPAILRTLTAPPTGPGKRRRETGMPASKH